jgi:hypothetical protein
LRSSATTSAGGAKRPAKVEDVAHLRGAEGIDRLGVVADDGEPAAVRLQAEQDRRLQPVGVLVLVDQHMVEARRHRRAGPARPSAAAHQTSRSSKSSTRCACFSAA